MKKMSLFIALAVVGQSSAFGMFSGTGTPITPSLREQPEDQLAICWCELKNDDNREGERKRNEIVRELRRRELWEIQSQLAATDQSEDNLVRLAVQLLRVDSLNDSLKSRCLFESKQGRVVGTSDADLAKDKEKNNISYFSRSPHSVIGHPSYAELKKRLHVSGLLSMDKRVQAQFDKEVLAACVKEGHISKDWCLNQLRDAKEHKFDLYFSIMTEK